SATLDTYTFTPSNITGTHTVSGAVDYVAGSFDIVVEGDTDGPGSAFTGPTGTVHAPFNVSLSWTDAGVAEIINGFTASDVTVANATVALVDTGGDVSGGDGVSSVILAVTPTGGTPITLDLDAGRVTDEAGNPNRAATQYSVAYGAAGDPADTVDFAMEFIDDPVDPGDAATLRFTVTNNAAVDLTAGSFSVDFNTALSGATGVTPVATAPCGVGSSASLTSANRIYNVSAFNLLAGASCTFDQVVQVPGGAAESQYRFASSNPSYALGGSGVTDQAMATQLVLSLAEGGTGTVQFSKRFLSDEVEPGASIDLEFTLAASADFSTTSMVFTDDLDAALSGLVATGLPAADVCGSGSTLSGTSSLTFSGGSLATGGSCTFTVTLAVPGGAADGTYTNTTSALSFVRSDTGADTQSAASASFDVAAPAATPPTVTITGSAADLGVGVSRDFEIRFSEPIDELLVSDLSVVNATLSNFAGAGAVFGFSLSPDAPGAVSVQVPAAVAQDGAGEDNQASNTVSLTGVTGSPEIAVTGNGADIADCSALALESNYTRFFAADTTAGTSSRSFTISNSGTGNLTTASVSITGANAADFSVTTFAAGVVAPGSSTLLVITFDPSAAGDRTATVTINNDDVDEAVFDFAIAGEGVSAPEMNVSDSTGTIAIASGSASTSSAAGTDFGTLNVDGETASSTFRIANAGAATLTLGVNAVSIQSDGAYTVTAQPATTVPPFAFTTFTVQFDPSLAASQSAVVSIANDDSDESPYTFGLTGSGLDNQVPTGHSVTFDASLYGPATASSASFTIDDPEIYSTYSYTITSSGGAGSVTGSGTVPLPNAGDPSELQVTGVDISSLPSGTVTVSVVLTDDSSNAAPAVTNTATLDLTAPTVALTTGSADPVSGAFTLTATFSEDVTGFALGDFTVGNGAASAFSATSATVYTVLITPAGDGAVTVDVAAAAAQDTAGNDNTAAAQFSITNDETAPTVDITGPTAVQIGAFSVSFDFSEDVTGFALEDISVGNGTASGFAGSGDAYTATITPAATGSVSVDVAASSAFDSAGNGNTAATQFAVQADLSLPTLDSLVVSDADLRLEDAGNTFSVTATFSEAMAPASVPSFAFETDLSATLSLVDGAFSTGNTVYVANYLVADGGQVASNVDITVSGAADAAGNTLADSTVADLFAVEMRRGSLNVAVAVTGAVDGAFDFSGDLGDFTVTTASQAGNVSFTDLAEGTYTFVGAAADDFALDAIACSGGTTVTDVGAGSVTVTLGPTDSVSCQFTQIADPGIDETQIPDVSIELPSLTDDPTGTSTVFSLDNVGGSALYFTAATDQPWLTIDPSSGSIPASGSLDFTVTFTAAVLDLDPGTYTATITITETNPPAQHGGRTKANTLQSINIPVTVTLEPRLGDLTIIASTTTPEEGEGSFSFASTLAVLDGQTLTTAGGTASLSLSDVLRGSYSLSQLNAEGWDLASISCSGDTDGGNVYDLVNGQVTIDLDPEESMVCTFTNRRNEDYIRAITLSAIRNFMATRADLILTNSPSLAGRMRGDRTGATPNRFVADYADGRFGAQMSTSLSALRTAAQSSRPQQPGSEQFSLAGRTGMASLDVWAQASISSVTDNRAGLSANSDFAIYHIGTDVMVSDRLMVGVLVQYDQTEMTTGEWNSVVEGDGWMAGPYMVASLSDTTFFDLRAAWGRSDNTVNPIGTYTDEFETDRWMLEANLAGDILMGQWRVTPGVGLAYFNEEQAAYRDSLGIDIPSQSITIGRITAGPEIAYRFENADGSYFEPYLQINALFDYDDADVFNAGGQLQTLGHMRADARLGLAAELSNGGRITGEVSMIGVGEGNFEANSAMVRVRLPLSLH
ncbi:Ig-like domain-containing protein, partial [uncultured Maricaulis sp.]|uniref:Ig-like domain-containing protein n=1 Tax=uncultured Maricaulis sp. TaxID=174710 RepID=UPI0030DB4A86